jgi:hypothetical protein
MPKSIIPRDARLSSNTYIEPPVNTAPGIFKGVMPRGTYKYYNKLVIKPSSLFTLVLFILYFNWLYMHTFIVYRI